MLAVAAPYLALLVLNEPVFFCYYVDEGLVHVGQLRELLITTAAYVAAHSSYSSSQC